MVLTRRAIHLMFATAALPCVVALGFFGQQLRQARQSNRAVAASAQEAPGTPPDVSTADRRVALAHAVARAKAGDTEAALRGFNGLPVRGAGDDVSRAALFDMGNLYLRQGIHATGNPEAVLPLFELAKQQYRELLRADPFDWDARFNLERTLRHAPEDKEAFEQPDDRPVERPPNRPPDLLAPDLP